MRAFRSPLPALLLAAAVAACSAPAANPSPPAPGDGAASLATTLQVETSREGVRLVMQVTNVTEAPLRLVFASGRTHDFVVTDGAREVWRWSEGRAFTQAVQERTLEPGETLALDAAWSPPDGLDGEFTARGSLAAAEHPATAATVFRLP